MKTPYDQQYFDEMQRYSARSALLKIYRRQVDAAGGKRVLDVGCGHGYLVRHLIARGYDAVGVDSAECAGGLIPSAFVRADALEGLPFKDKEFDTVISTDFLEHISETDLPFVTKEMERVGNRVLAHTCHKPEHRSTGVDTHLTKQRGAWWKRNYPNITFF